MNNDELTCTVCKSTKIILTKKVATSQIPIQLNLEWGLKLINDNSLNELQTFDYVSHYFCQECFAGSWIPKIPGDAKFYEALSPIYVDKRWEKSVISKSLDSAHSILDVGSGPDPIFKMIKRRNSDNDAIIEENQLVLDKMNFVGIIAYKSPIEILQTPKKFSSICALHFLEHIPNPKEYFANLVDILTPDGDMWISVPNRDRHLDNSFFESLDVPPHHLTTWNLQGLISFGEQLGLIPTRAWVSNPNSKQLLKKIWRKINPNSKQLLKKVLRENMETQYFEISDVINSTEFLNEFRGYQILVRFIRIEK